MSLEEVFSSVMNVAAHDVSDATKRSAMAVWTSLQHVRLVAALEREFSVSFEPKEIVRMRSVGDIRKFLVTKGVAL